MQEREVVRSGTIVILLAFVVQANVKELPMNDTDNARYSTEKIADNLIDKLVDKLVAPSNPVGNLNDDLLSRTDLDDTTLGLPASAAARALPRIDRSSRRTPPMGKLAILRQQGPGIQTRSRPRTLLQAADSPAPGGVFSVFEKESAVDKGKFDSLGRLQAPYPPGMFSSVGRMLEVHKAIWFPLGLASMYLTGEWSFRACLMTALFGAYGIIWVLKSNIYPDLNFYNGEDSKIANPLAYLINFALIGVYFVYPVLAALNKAQLDPVTTIVSPLLFCIGGFLHWAGDAQRYFQLKYSPGKLITDGFYAHMRHPSYAGEIIMWLALSLLSGPQNPLSWLPVGWLLMITVLVGIPKKEKSLSRFPEFEEWKKRTPMLVPGLR